MSRPAAQRGVTLIETVASIVIIAIAVSALTFLVSDATRRSADPMIQEQAGAIARAYLEEITLKRFCDPDFDNDGDPATPLDCPAQCTAPACGLCGGPGAGLQEPARALFDDVCDYDGLADSGARDQTGAALPALGAYGVAVQVRDSGVSLDALDGGAGEVVRIDVTVSHPAMPVPVALSGYRANF